MLTEDDLGWKYFGTDLRSSARMMPHMEFHSRHENINRTGNYGERFLTFHQGFLEDYNIFRRAEGFPVVGGWDPSTRIPGSLKHDHVNGAPRLTDYPSRNNARCITPTWATEAGGSVPSPIYGHYQLGDFLSLDELGREIDPGDGGWHMTVHTTIGGDMTVMGTSPIDPVFWAWHQWIDLIRNTWVTHYAHQAAVYTSSPAGLINTFSTGGIANKGIR